MFHFPSLAERLSHYRLTEASDWRDRCVVWSAAAAAGLVVVLFTYLTDYAIAGFMAVRANSVYWPFAISPLGAMLVVWLTRKFAPGSAGSGIPQVMSALSPALPADAIRGFVSIRIAAAKILLGAGALFSGFSSGREGPSVQVAASIMHACRRGLGRSSVVQPQHLLLAGGAAGIAAAFNTPLAGIIFAIEELSKRFEQRSSGIVVGAIILAGLVAIALEGNFTYFGTLRVPPLNTGLIAPALLCALLGGGLGGLFSRLLIQSSTGSRGRIHAFRRMHPVAFAGLCGLGIAVLGWVSGGAAHGSGYFYTREMLDGTREMPVLYVVIKFVATWLSFWSGVPGGIFAPSLAIGAGLGNDIALLFGVAIVPLAALGMVAFLSAATQAPITSFIIVMEMIDGHSMVLSLMATALIANVISKLLSPSLYATLSQLQVQGVAPEADSPERRHNQT